MRPAKPDIEIQNVVPRYTFQTRLDWGNGSSSRIPQSFGNPDKATPALERNQRPPMSF